MKLSGSLQEALQEAPQEALQETFQEALQEAFQEALRETFQNAFQGAFKRLSGGLQEALGNVSEAICVSKALNSVWKETCDETIVFFHKSDATDHVQRRVAKAT